MWTTAKGQNAFDQDEKQIRDWVNYYFLRANSINNYQITKVKRFNPFLTKSKWRKN